MKPLPLSPHHKPPVNPSPQYLADMAWLKGFAATKANGKTALKAAAQAEREHLERTAKP